MVPVFRHPPQLGSTPSKWRIILIIAMVSPGIPRAASAQSKPPNDPPAHVVAQCVVQRDVVISHTFVGTVMPTRTSIVGSPVEGQVIAYQAREGDYVHKGDKLAQLRPTKLQIQLAGAQAELALLKSQLEDLRVALPISIEQAKARKLAAEALQKYASEQYKRGENLGSLAPVASAELGELKSAADSAINIFAERSAALRLAEQTGPTKIAQAEARVRVQQETINELRDALDQHTIVAPFDGYITKEHTEVGQWIAKGGPVVEIVELSSVDIVVPVPETEIAELRVPTAETPGTPTQRITVEALPHEIFPGEVISIVPKADLQSRTFPVKVRVANRLDPHTNTVMLKPGMFARVALPVHTIKNAIMIPKDALVLDRRSPTVWRIKSPEDAKTAAGSPVQSLAVKIDAEVSVDNWIQLVGPTTQEGVLPLQAGDVVVTEGNERINRRSMVTTINQQISK